MAASVANCSRLLSTLVVAAILSVTVASLKEDISSLNCQCHVGKSMTQVIGISCRNGPSESDPATCNTAARGSIPSGYRYLPSLGLYKLHTLGKSYAKAREACAKEGARLAIPKNDNMAAALARFFTAGNTIEFAYVGINDIASEGQYEDDAGEMASYLSWSEGEPNNVGGVENCVNIGKAGRMNDVPCVSVSPFFCERKLKVRVPQGYQFLDGHGFYKVYRDRATFAEAEGRCLGEGAYLAVPETLSEGEALVQITRVDRLTDAWIGIVDRDIEGRFRTLHGTPVEDLEFDNWEDMEPNDAFKNEDCVTFLASGAINDATCTNLNPFICELVTL